MHYGWKGTYATGSNGLTAWLFYKNWKPDWKMVPIQSQKVCGLRVTSGRYWICTAVLIPLASSGPKLSSSYNASMVNSVQMLSHLSWNTKWKNKTTAKKETCKRAGIPDLIPKGQVRSGYSLFLFTSPTSKLKVPYGVFVVNKVTFTLSFFTYMHCLDPWGLTNVLKAFSPSQTCS